MEKYDNDSIHKNNNTRRFSSVVLQRPIFVGSYTYILIPERRRWLKCYCIDVVARRVYITSYPLAIRYRDRIQMSFLLFYFIFFRNNLKT